MKTDDNNPKRAKCVKVAHLAKEEEQKHMNDVLCFGSGDMSQLGLGANTRERKNPALIKSLNGNDPITIASGAMHNAIITREGQVWTWG